MRPGGRPLSGANTVMKYPRIITVTFWPCGSPPTLWSMNANGLKCSWEPQSMFPIPGPVPAWARPTQNSVGSAVKAAVSVGERYERRFAISIECSRQSVGAEVVMIRVRALQNYTQGGRIPLNQGTVGTMDYECGCRNRP